MKLLALVFLFVSTTSFAKILGGHDGGGGRGIVCYDQKGAIESVELLDFFEGRTLEGYSIPEYQADYKTIYAEVIKKAASAKILKTLLKADRIEKGLKFLPAGVRLNPIEDSNEIFIPSNCKIEQLANFQGVSRIFIVKDFWDKLTETSKAGLLMHEYVWYLERESGVKSSARARRTVARFFAENFDFGKIELDVKIGDINCNAINPYVDLGEGLKKNWGASFYSTEIPGTNSCLLSFTHLNSVLNYTKHTAILKDCSDWNFGKAWQTSDDSRYISNMTRSLEVISAPDNTLSHTVMLSLNVVNGERIFTLRSYNKEFPGFDDSKDMRLDCGHPLDATDLEDAWWEED